MVQMSYSRFGEIFRQMWWDDFDAGKAPTPLLSRH
jgi:hypothetical protein